MASLDINADDFKYASVALQEKNFKGTAGQAVGPALRDSGNIVRRHVRAELAPHRRSGKTASHIESRVTGVGLSTVVTVKAASKTAHLLEGGTAAHEEVARGGSGGAQLGGSGKVMTIRGGGASNGAFAGFGIRAIRSEGQIVALASRVHHPGSRADPFFERGVRDAAPEVQSRIDEAAVVMTATLDNRMKRR